MSDSETPEAAGVRVARALEDLSAYNADPRFFEAMANALEHEEVAIVVISAMADYLSVKRQLPRLLGTEFERLQQELAITLREHSNSPTARTFPVPRGPCRAG